MKARLGINTCFAVKRWPEPGDWARIVRDELGLEVVERAIDRTELFTCDELFLCGTGAQVSPVVEVDRRTVGDGRPGRLSRRLQEIYFRAVRGDEPRYREWLTPVY